MPSADVVKRSLLVLRLRNALIGPGLLLFFSIILYWNLIASPSKYAWFDHYDLCQIEIPRLQFFARSIHSGHLPLWNPHSWLGQPVLGSAQPGLLNPLNLIFTSLVPLKHGELSFGALNWLFVSLHVFGGWFCYLFCRGRSLPVIPSITGGLAFAFTGFFGTSPHIDLASAAALTPLIFLFVFRLWDGGPILSNAVPLGLVLGIAWLTGHHEIPLISCYTVLLASLVVAVYRLFRSRRIEWSILVGVAIAFSLAGAISAVQTLPMIEFGHLAKRWVNMSHPIEWGERVSYDVHTLYSMPWRGVAEFLVPREGIPIWSGYVGVTVLVLVALSLIHLRDEPTVVRLGILGVYALLYPLGAHTPFHRILYETLPMMDKARSPDRGLYLIGFVLSALAAFGSDTLIKNGIPRRHITWIAIVCAIPVGVGLSSHEPYAWKSFAAGALLLFIAWNAARPNIYRLGGCALIAMVLIEATTCASYRMAYVGSGNGVCAWALRDYRELGDRLRKDTSLHRVAADYNQLMTDIGSLFGVDAVQSFVSGVPSDVLRLELHSAHTGQLVGVTHRVAKREPLADEKVIGQYARGIQLFEVKSAMPRAWIVHQVEVVKNDDALRRSIFDPTTNFAVTAVMLNRDISITQCPGSDSVNVFSPNSDTLIADANLHCRGLLVVSDAFYPGWHAYVDRRPEPIIEVFGALRGVVLDAGSHTIEMRYEPFSVYVGVVIGVLGIVSCAICEIASRAGAR
jgi:hypothetical protein